MSATAADEERFFVFLTAATSSPTPSAAVADLADFNFVFFFAPSTSAPAAAAAGTDAEVARFLLTTVVASVAAAAVAEAAEARRAVGIVGGRGDDAEASVPNRNLRVGVAACDGVSCAVAATAAASSLRARGVLTAAAAARTTLLLRGRCVLTPKANGTGTVTAAVAVEGRPARGVVAAVAAVAALALRTDLRADGGGVSPATAVAAVFDALLFVAIVVVFDFAVSGASFSSAAAAVRFFFTAAAAVDGATTPTARCCGEGDSGSGEAKWG